MSSSYIPICSINVLLKLSNINTWDLFIWKVYPSKVTASFASSLPRSMRVRCHKMCLSLQKPRSISTISLVQQKGASIIALMDLLYMYSSLLSSCCPKCSVQTGTTSIPYANTLLKTALTKVPAWLGVKPLPAVILAIVHVWILCAASSLASTCPA